MHKEVLEDLGEKELIQRLGSFLPKKQILDDCAFLETKKNNLLVNSDALVENVHFDERTISAIDVGWKAVISNLSDLQSSGSKKVIGITVSLILPAKTEWIWIEELYKGMNKGLTKYGGVILGGDCSLGNQKVISISAFGIQGELKLQKRCKPGEIILTTGIHGLSKLGFMIKNKNNFSDDFFLSKRLIKKSIKHFCKPKLKTHFLKKLKKSRPNKKLTKIGCTDSSDGLFQAIQDLSVASECKAVINYTKMPKDKDWPKGEVWDEYYFFGGEDYKLVFSLPKQWAENLLKLDKTIIEVGYFTKGKASVVFKDPKNNKLLKFKPFKHF